MDYLINFLCALAITVVVTPILIKISYKIKFTDRPTKRKKHKKITPLCGGLSMYIGFFLVYFFVGQVTEKKIYIFIGSTMILLIGLIDDYYKSKGKEFKITPRLIIQIVAAYLVYRAGVAFTGFTNPFTGEYILLNHTLQLILSITWIFGVTTVINWSDGMDGLAGGISLVSTITFFVAAIILGQVDSASVSSIMAGVLVGFLIFNVHPAKMFMGDSGANFLGFILSIIALDGAFKQATVLSILLPILALAVPIFDNLFVIIKRYSEGKAVYEADRSQIHFRLEAKGFSPKQTVGCIVGISIMCSIISIVLLFYNHF